jgi:ssDNA-binding Zn-finger/Zn-ribbon topoisomerase 1
MRVKQKGSKFFLGCHGYPNCKHTEYVSVDLVNDYLLDYRKGEVRCYKDNTTIEAKLGPYGLYITCNGLNQHKIKLDEI